MTEEEFIEYFKTPEGWADWLKMLAAIPGVETMDTEEVKRFIVEAVRQYTQKRAQ